MPSYEYRCDACEHEFEEFQGIKDAPLKKCPQCKKNKLRRLISGGAAIVFKGSGFYQTDYRSEAYKNSAKADSTDKNKNTNTNSQPSPAPATQVAKHSTPTESSTKKEPRKNESAKTKE
ncbi:MAG: zinc ribbon domain-containing protein [Planctomycetaceae bacterium]|jgi:putative FmdB family regulatory protein|nr:zinc ribbon domain-containing protein [Planctomycetaceae bacterium]